MSKVIVEIPDTGEHPSVIRKWFEKNEIFPRNDYTSIAYAVVHVPDRYPSYDGRKDKWRIKFPKNTDPKKIAAFLLKFG